MRMKVLLPNIYMWISDFKETSIWVDPWILRVQPCQVRQEVPYWRLASAIFSNSTSGIRAWFVWSPLGVGVSRDKEVLTKVQGTVKRMADMGSSVNGEETQPPTEGEDLKKWKVRAGKAMYVLSVTINKYLKHLFKRKIKPYSVVKGLRRVTKSNVTEETSRDEVVGVVANKGGAQSQGELSEAKIMKAVMRERSVDKKVDVTTTGEMATLPESAGGQSVWKGMR
ncbi:Retrovirus-related Pol polyprotein from transposon TNT 1-94 [Senna tora]|uniref:Retrovirus-related Pol polyprotein from transposon TNT 1-94 n=1 Tax=Senna tora TaxID=362788 RepID=A0A834X8S0_9FABA|nr:Retrovirus-related Pol polyprotein from transposon TNT 1-94 [Senna tora]